MKAGKHTSITLAGRKVEYRVIRSKAAQKLRVRVGPKGVEVLQPAEREDGDVTAFLRANSWPTITGRPPERRTKTGVSSRW